MTRQAIERAINEIEIMSICDHPNVMGLSGAFETHTKVTLVLELYVAALHDAQAPAHANETHSPSLPMLQYGGRPLRYACQEEALHGGRGALGDLQSPARHQLPSRAWHRASRYIISEPLALSLSLSLTLSLAHSLTH